MKILITSLGAALLLSACGPYPHKWPNGELVARIPAKAELSEGQLAGRGVKATSLKALNPNETKRLAAYIYFDNGQSTLTREHKLRLNEVADSALLLADYDVILTGHSDKHGKSDAKQRVSELRTAAATRYLLDRGIPPHRIIANSESDHERAAKGDNPYADHLNRRVDIHIIPRR